MSVCGRCPRREQGARDCAVFLFASQPVFLGLKAFFLAPSNASKTPVFMWLRCKQRLKPLLCSQRSLSGSLQVNQFYNSDILELALATKAVRKFRGQKTMAHLCERQTGHMFYKQILGRLLTKGDIIDSFAFLTDESSHKQLITAIASECAHPMAPNCSLQTIGATFTYSTEKITAHLLALKHIGDPLIKRGVQDESLRPELQGFYSAFLDIMWGPAGQCGSDEESIELAETNFGAARNKLRIQIVPKEEQLGGFEGQADDRRCYQILCFLTGSSALESEFEVEKQAIACWRNELLRHPSQQTHS
jgi:hypothetical protein